VIKTVSLSLSHRFFEYIKSKTDKKEEKKILVDSSLYVRVYNLRPFVTFVDR
jgi:hypothetical protein